MDELPNTNEIPQQAESHYSTLNEERQIELFQYEPNNKMHPLYNSDISIPPDAILSFDNVLTQIGIGKYQAALYLVAIILGITEGAQVTIFTLMIPILENEWHISQSIVSLQTSFVFVGFLIGSLVSGQFIDRYGRKAPFLMSSTLTVLVCFATVFCTNIYQLLLMRALLGIFVGFFAPCCVTTLQEITPTAYRAQLTSIVTFSVSIGQLYGILCASFTLESMTEGNWKLLTVWGTLPGILGMCLSFLIVKESPRFDLLQNRQAEAFETLNQIIQWNGSTYELNDEVKWKLKNWGHAMNRIAKNNKNASIKCLFQGDRCVATSVLWLVWFSLCFTYYGNLMLMPSMLSTLNSDQGQLLQLVYACFSDIIGAAIASALIDKKGFGRRNSLMIGFALSLVMSILIYYDYKEHFTLWAILQKLFLSMNFIYCYQLSTEIYPTKLRATGLGLGIAMGRFGGIAMPWACIYASSISISTPFLMFGVVCGIAGLFTYFLPNNTVGKDLDNTH